MKYKVEKDNYGTFKVYKCTFFGMFKEPIARFQTELMANYFIDFMKDPLFAFRNTGCNDNTRKYLKEILNRMAKEM